MDSVDQLHAMRHSLAHIMATAIQELYPSAKFGVGPVVEHGFYYDVDLEERLGEDDLTKIEHKMKEIIKAAYPFEHTMMPLAKAIEYFGDKGQVYKVNLLNDLRTHGTTVAGDIDRDQLGIEAGEAKVNEVSIYTDGPFTDLCRGPHVEATNKVGAFKIMRVSGAYWRGDEKNAQLQRIYGVGFTTKDELHKHLEMLKQAEARDHRKLGRELDLFLFSDLIGPGLPLFTPKGTVLRNELIKYSEELQRKGGYEAVWAPHIARTELYKTSGHYDKYPERFGVTSVESDDDFMMKPMNCPHVAQIYASRPRSYRDLPQRYMETTTMYRDEKSGEMHGLSRVRALTQDDSHAFVRQDQVEAEMRSIIQMTKQMYDTLGFELSVDLSFRDDSDKYFGDPKLWAKAQAEIRAIAEDESLDYQVMEGEAAFYGPKIDVYIADSLGRRWQCATIQIDYVQPERFGLTYTDGEGNDARPVMIHKAILGSIERFLSVYIEHTAGAFSTWVAPEQVRLAPINDTPDLLDYVEQLRRELAGAGIRVTIDSSSESVGKKIRAAGLAKVPYTIVVGEKERETGLVNPRLRTGHGNEPGELTLATFIDGLRREIDERRATSAF